MENKSVFLKAIEVLERDGWYQGDYYQRGDGAVDGPCCLVGACARAADMQPGKWENTPESKFLSNSIFNRSVLAWNDRDGRTKEEVIALLKNVDEEYTYSKNPAANPVLSRTGC